MKIKLLFIALSALILTACSGGSGSVKSHPGSKPVGITKTAMEIAGISRNQNNKNKIHPAFAFTSRKCPPFCIQPTHPFAPAKVETISELDIIHAARDIANGDKTKLLMDNRTPVWTTAKKGGTIPHSVNIPFNTINSKAIAKDPDAVMGIITSKFGVTEQDGILNFNNAKTLFMFCNGAWCGQSPAGIKALLKLGYPESKLKYYRGGMNAWHRFGLTTVNR